MESLPAVPGPVKLKGYAKRSGTKSRKSGRMVTAQEIASFAYCPEQWRLQYGLGLPPLNQEALDATGTLPVRRIRRFLIESSGHSAP